MAAPTVVEDRDDQLPEFAVSVVGLATELAPSWAGAHSSANSSHETFPWRLVSSGRGCVSWWVEVPLVLGSDSGEARRMLRRHTARRRFPTEPGG